MAFVGFEPGSDDPKHDTLATRPPRRDGWGALVDHFVFFPGGLIYRFEGHCAIVERHRVCRAGAPWQRSAVRHSRMQASGRARSAPPDWPPPVT